MNIDKQKQINDLFDLKLQELKNASSSEKKWELLESLHIIGQLSIPLHYRVHGIMLRLAEFPLCNLCWYQRILIYPIALTVLSARLTGSK